MTADTYTIRIARHEDAPAIQGVAAIAWHATYNGIYCAVEIDDFLEQNYSIDSLVRAIDYTHEDNFRRFDVAEHNGRILAFMQMSRNAEGAPWLWRLYVLPSHQRRGIGSTLLSSLESHLRKHGEKGCCLHVQKQNVMGQSFYLKHGFVHRTDLDKGDAWHMEKVLN